MKLKKPRPMGSNPSFVYSSLGQSSSSAMRKTKSWPSDRATSSADRFLHEACGVGELCDLVLALLFGFLAQGELACDLHLLEADLGCSPWRGSPVRLPMVGHEQQPFDLPAELPKAALETHTGSFVGHLDPAVLEPPLTLDAIGLVCQSGRLEVRREVLDLEVVEVVDIGE